jgi:hypothetical protein
LAMNVPRGGEPNELVGESAGGAPPDDPLGDNGPGMPTDAALTRVAGGTFGLPGAGPAAVLLKGCAANGDADCGDGGTTNGDANDGDD